ncbi:MAG: S8 family serine peptidase [Promethearchaeota archaeon]
MKSKSGLSIDKDLEKLSLSTLDGFLPKSANIKNTAKILKEAGFDIEAQTKVGILFSGSKELFEAEFGVSISKREIKIKSPEIVERSVSFFEASKPKMMSDKISTFAESVQLVVPAVHFQSANPPTPNPPYYYLDVLNDVPAILNVTTLHDAGITGAGVRISMVDTGFFLHPYYSAQGYNIGEIRSVGGLDENVDEVGHGTAMAANILAVAPGATFSFVKYTDGTTNNYPSVAFVVARADQNPDIITCSWGTLGHDDFLLLEIAVAVADGIVVIFAAGNGHTDDPVPATVQSLAHPNLISVGGAYPIEGGGFRASNFASSYDSFVYTNPQRHCPDVVGLVGEMPQGILIMLPTQPDGEAWAMDRDLSAQSFPNGDNTTGNDGWCVCSGTSAAAPQVAGIVALLLQQYPNLTPMAVKNVLENSARDIQTGSSSEYSAGPDNAAPGWDAATGFGLVDGEAALNFLQQGKFNAYIRDSIEDNGTEPIVLNRLWASPDIIVRTEEVEDPQEMLGITVKHRHDLSDQVEDGQDNYVYLRVQNRGTDVGSCTATVYFTVPGMLPNPASWENIGQINIPDLESGEFRVIGPIIWSDAQIPRTGHFCLISILDSPSDPAPDLNTIHTIADFRKMVRDKNNVAWKNITIVDVIPGGTSSFSFYMEGPLGKYHQADLQVDLTQFAPKADVLVRMVKRLAATAKLNNMNVTHESKLYTTLTHLGKMGTVEGMDFKSNEETKVTIYYTVPKKTPDGAYPIRATLLVDGEQVGSFTEMINISHFVFVGNRKTKEVHNKTCAWMNMMSPYNRKPFGDLSQAHRHRYDNCAHCIGESKR